ncbi:phosphate ABC transporter substrate-binding protein PstS [Marinitenerispora sediminis]|uniref:Phosphate-binding protein n=1 Tax=Marinitenerispora sediminis TaxID=1931232 RepID=A0A368T9Y7_9ACTN|nr:phosphate ABC transporter substrate-binding protein PstS [Marinitenerispora sediminis]RCV52533.1 phosphate ABC transporter substrate-binding protein PstS [Marinitenerispora sediminis]RCV59492.1 phosphate ABC transporter substrate-binding protein PstS [Marinitenerispora sediminis]RCV59599.1 phosphate ABC transporter substrate-binding protein PstS [Marinitenerispora sediminis]
MLPSTSRGLSAIALIGVLAATAGCGSDNAVRGNERLPVPADLECPPGSLSGSGSSAQENAMQVWIAGYQTACEDSRVYYDAIGSGGGRSQFVDGAVAFAGSDAALDPEEAADAAPRCHGSEAINLPAYVVPIAVVFHLEGVDSLNMTPETIARVFAGEITFWDDPAIAASNPGTDLPHDRITPVSRSDESGTTENFTAYLSAAAADAWPYEASGQWPVPAVEAAQGNSGVAQALEGGDGTIGYVEASHVGSLSTVRVGVGDEFVAPDPEAAAAVVAASPQRPGGSEHDHALELDYATTEPGTYPVVLVSYEVACLRYADAAEAERVTGFLRYVLSEEGQRAASEETGSAPLPESTLADLRASLDAIGAA